MILYDGNFIHYVTFEILNVVWTYGVQLWGCTNQSNKDIIQRFQNKVLRNIFGAPWYIRKAELHSDLQMEMVTNEIGTFAKKGSPPRQGRSDPAVRQQ
jgi:hypothetical protein